MENLLYYTKPTAFRKEALSLGNGIMGDMRYVGFDNEMIRLNHAELRSGEPYKKIPDNKTEKRSRNSQIMTFLP